MVKTNRYVGRFSVVEDLFKCCNKAKHGIRIKAFAIDPWIAEESIIRSEYQGIGIKEV
jgi:hypothetical protein